MKVPEETVKAWQMILKALAIIACVLSVLFAVAMVALDQFGKGECVNEITATTSSPDRKLQAVIFRRKCGITVSDSTEVSVIPAAEALPDNAIGNVFDEDLGHNNPETMDVLVQWLSANEINITYDRDARVNLQQKEVQISEGATSRRVSIVFSPVQHVH
jgi:hypothetical protein